MLIKKIKLLNFRNYEKIDLDFSSGINIIYGKNGQGKTNLIESIFYLSKAKSHRISDSHHLIKNNSSSFNIKGIINNDNNDTKYQVSLNNDEKVFKIDSTIIKKNSEYISNIDIIIFYPEDLEIIKGAPSIRRNYINDELSQLYINYYNVLSDYNKLLKMKNDYLKNNNYDINYLNILNSYFIDKAVMITKMRKKFIDKINEYCTDIYKKIMNLDDFSIKYIPSINFESFDVEKMKIKFSEELKNHFSEELKLKTSVVGPHRDDIEFYLKDKK